MKIQNQKEEKTQIERRAYLEDPDWKLVPDNLVAGEDPWTSSLRGSLAPLGYVKVCLPVFLHLTAF